MRTLQKLINVGDIAAHRSNPAPTHTALWRRTIANSTVSFAVGIGFSLSCTFICHPKTKNKVGRGGEYGREEFRNTISSCSYQECALSLLSQVAVL